MPLGEERVLEHFIVVQLLAERGSELLHLGVRVDEVLAQGLEEVLLAIFVILRHELREDGLERVPVLHDVPVLAENAAHRDVKLVVTRHVKLELELADLAEDVVGVARARLCHLLSDEALELLASTH